MLPNNQRPGFRIPHALKSIYIRLESGFENAFAWQSCRQISHNTRSEVQYDLGSCFWCELAARLVGLSLWRYASTMSSLVGEQGAKDPSCTVEGRDPVPASFGSMYITWASMVALQRFHRSGMTHSVFPGTFSVYAWRACGLIFSRDLYQIAEGSLETCRVD